MKRDLRLFSALRLASRLTGLGLLAIAVAFMMSGMATPVRALEAGDSTALEKLVVVTDARGAHPVDHQLQVEVMRTDEGRERGLMERRFLPPDRGMLFDFGHEQSVMMWMKNTYIPLDMIFMARNGVVTHIAENAEPLSEAIISSQGPAFAVLEVNAGFARKIGLKPGDAVRHSLFSR
jgi:uncharacterized membrane protein (UPF0127 family)